VVSAVLARVFAKALPSEFGSRLFSAFPRFGGSVRPAPSPVVTTSPTDAALGTSHNG